MQEAVEYLIGSRVRCADDECGELEFVVVDPVADKLTHLVVRPDDADAEPRLVPVHLAVPGPDGVELNCTRARFEEFAPAVRTHFLTGIDAAGVAVRLAKDEIKDLPPVDVEGL